MDEYTYQYRIFSDVIDLLVTTKVDDREYAVNLGRKVAKDHYGLDDKQLEDLKCGIVVLFINESVINLNVLQSTSTGDSK